MHVKIHKNKIIKYNQFCYGLKPTKHEFNKINSTHQHQKPYPFTSNTTNQQIKTLTDHIHLHPTPQINISKHNIKKPQNQIMHLLCHVIVLIFPPPCRSLYPSTTTSCCCPHSSIVTSRHHPCPFSYPPLPSKERVWVRNGQIKYLIVLFKSFHIKNLFTKLQ